MRVFAVRLGLAATAAAALILSGVAPAEAIPPGPTSLNFPSLMGRVVACNTLQPIGGAVVTVSPVVQPADPTAVESNRGGHYMVVGLAAGQYLVSVAAEGYFNPGVGVTAAPPVLITIPPGPNVSPDPTPVFLNFGLTPIGHPPQPCVPPGPNNR
jgi:hypothetical protein